MNMLNEYVECLRPRETPSEPSEMQAADGSSTR